MYQKIHVRSLNNTVWSCYQRHQSVNIQIDKQMLTRRFCDKEQHSRSRGDQREGYMKVLYLKVKGRGAPDASCWDLWLESL